MYSVTLQRCLQLHYTPYFLSVFLHFSLQLSTPLCLSLSDLYFSTSPSFSSSFNLSVYASISTPTVHAKLSLLSSLLLPVSSSCGVRHLSALSQFSHHRRSKYTWMVCLRIGTPSRSSHQGRGIELVRAPLSGEYLSGDTEKVKKCISCEGN